MAARTVTIRVYQRAIEELADDPNDPINEVLDGLAEQVREKALENVRKILKGQGPADFDLDVVAGKDSKGIFFRVQPQDGRISRYLSWKEFREHSWLAPAITAVIGQGGIRRAGSRNFPRGAGFSR